MNWLQHNRRSRYGLGRSESLRRMYCGHLEFLRRLLKGFWRSITVHQSARLPFPRHDQQTVLSLAVAQSISKLCCQCQLPHFHATSILLRSAYVARIQRYQYRKERTRSKVEYATMYTFAVNVSRKAELEVRGHVKEGRRTYKRLSGRSRYSQLELA